MTLRVPRVAVLAAVSATIAAPVHADSGHQARMLRTAYCLSGTTRTGTPVGPGTVAVDPRVIPLGSRMWVEGYGYGVARDTGGAVRGLHVDVWMASCSAALGFTRRGVLVRWWR